MTENQRIFAEEYLTDLNASRAYAAAYPGVTAVTARTNAAKLLKKEEIRAHIRARLKERQEKTHITEEQVLLELAEIAFADIGALVRVEDGKLTAADTAALTPGQRRIIAGVREGRGGIEYRFCDRLRALELLGRHLGMFDRRKDALDKTEQEAKIAKLRAETRTEEEDAAVTVRFIETEGAEE